MCLVLNQFFIVCTIPCATFHDLTQTARICFNCYYSLHSSVCTITIVRLIFITEIFKPRLFSLHATCLHTILTEFFLNCLFCLVWWMYLKENVFVCIDVNKLLALLFIFVLAVLVFLVYPLFYTDVSIFLFIRW